MSLQHREGLVRDLWSVQKLVISLINSSRDSHHQRGEDNPFSSSSYSSSAHDGDNRTVDNFPHWDAFALCSVPTEEDIKTTVLIHPTLGRRFAVPVLLETTHREHHRTPPEDRSKKPSVNDVVAGLWDFFDLRHYTPVHPEDNVDFALTKRIFFLQRLIMFINDTSFTSFNEIIGTFVLRRTIERWLGCYATKEYIRKRIGATYEEWEYCVDQLIEPSTETSALWKKAAEITGY
jgi:hypothetical protein